MGKSFIPRAYARGTAKEGLEGKNVNILLGKAQKVETFKHDSEEKAYFSPIYEIYLPVRIRIDEQTIECRAVVQYISPWEKFYCLGVRRSPEDIKNIEEKFLGPGGEINRSSVEGNFLDVPEVYRKLIVSISADKKFRRDFDKAAEEEAERFFRQQKLLGELQTSRDSTTAAARRAIN